ncbi:MAG: hypothetical protein ABJH63_03760 [Rhizobiaceae bacterium]
MKVTLNLTELLENGDISQEEYDRLLKLSSSGTSSLALNIFIAFGVISVAAGVLALVPTPLAAIALGAALTVAGLGLYRRPQRDWDILAHIFVLIGALVLAGGIIVLTEAAVSTFLMIAAGFALVGVLSHSGMLVTLAVLALASTIGARTGYAHASYFLGMEEPTVTVILMAALALACYLVSKKLSAAYERVALIAARTAVLVANFGFWIGSLWGDTLSGSGIHIPDYAFGTLWALGLLGLGIWAARNNLRWVVNVVAIFGAIHFYTQWFELLGAHPLSVLLCGLVTLGLALGLWKLNQRLIARQKTAGD